MYKKEDLKQKNLLYQLTRLRQSYINLPSFTRRIGERVQHGNIKESIILEILDEGKIYLLSENNTSTNSNDTFPRNIYVAWNQVTDYLTNEEILKKETFTKEKNIVIHTRNIQIESILNTYLYSGIDLFASYQRDFIWDNSDKVALIDSIFNNIEIGKFALIEKPFVQGDTKFEMLDGKQRFQALLDFYENRFSYKEIFFKELSPKDMNHFLNFPILLIITENLTLNQKYEYFLKLNTFGKPQDIKHMDKIRQYLKTNGVL